MRTTRYKNGSVVYDKRRHTWHLYTYDENGVRHSQRIGSKREYPTRASACRAADALRAARQQPSPTGPLLAAIIEGYRAEKMPKRWSTRRVYESRIKNWILPAWGHRSMLELEARPVEQWITSLKLSPRTQGALRGLIHQIWKYAIWSKSVPLQVNPISYVTIEGSSKRQKSFQSLTIEEGQQFLSHLTREPFHTIAIVCLCFGLRISECLALQWNDVDWIKARLRINKSIVRQRPGDTKTAYSKKPLPMAPELIEVLQTWRQVTEFKAESDWIFASPSLLGRKPWSDDAVRDKFRKAAKAAGLELNPDQIFGTHSMRNSYRSWLDAVGTHLSVQQKLMRHADIATTMNIYGDVVTDEMRQAQSKVVALALNSTQTARRDS